MRLLWLLPVVPILLITMAAAFVTLYHSTWLWVPTVILGSILGTGCLEKAAGASFFPKWVKGGSHGQTGKNQVACQPARNVKGSKR